MITALQIGRELSADEMVVWSADPWRPWCTPAREFWRAEMLKQFPHWAAHAAVNRSVGFSGAMR